MKKITTLLILLFAAQLSAQNVNFREGVNREVDTTTKLFFSNKPNSIVRLGLRVANDTTWLIYDGSNLSIIADTVFVNGEAVGSSLWEETNGTNAISQKGISPGGVGDNNYMAVVGRLGITRFLDATSQNPTHFVGYNATDSTTIPIYIQSGTLDGDTLKSKINAGAYEGQLAYWDTTTSKWAYADINKLRWKVDSTKLFAEYLQSDTISIGTTDKNEALNVIGRLSIHDSKNSVYVGKYAGVNVNFGQNEYNTGIGFAAMSEMTTGERNTAIGYNAIGADDIGEDNVAVGYYALRGNISSTQIFRYNVAIGSGALFANQVRDNTAVGYRSLYLNDFGTRNTATGSWSLYYNKGGNDNTAFGFQALMSNTTGYSNTAIGAWAMTDNQTTNFNTAMGRGALSKNVSGGSNTGIGYYSLQGTLRGSANTAIGGYSGNSTVNLNSVSQYYNDSTIQSTFLGYNTKALNSTDTNTIVIGYYAEGKGSNSVVIGNDAIDSTFLKGIVHVPTLSTETALILTPTASAPTNPVNGTIYFSSADNKLHIYANSAWYSLDLTAD